MHAKKRLVTSIAVLALIDIALLAGGFFAYRNIMALEQQITDSRGKLDQQLASSVALKAASQHTEEDRATVRKLSRMYMLGGSELEFIRTMERVAKESGVQQTMQLQLVNQKLITSWLSEIPVALSFTGSYDAVTDHLLALEALPYTIAVSDITFVGNGGRDGATTVSVTMTATTYRVGEQSPRFVVSPAPAQTDAPATPAKGSAQ